MHRRKTFGATRPRRFGIRGLSAFVGARIKLRLCDASGAALIATLCGIVTDDAIIVSSPGGVFLSDPLANNDCIVNPSKMGRRSSCCITLYLWKAISNSDRVSVRRLERISGLSVRYSRLDVALRVDEHQYVSNYPLRIMRPGTWKVNGCFYDLMIGIALGMPFAIPISY